METIYTRHFEVIRVESKWHQAKEGKTMYSLYCSFEHEGFLFTECFDFLNEPQLLQLRKRSFQGGKNPPPNPNNPPNPSLYLSVHRRKWKFYPPSCWTNSPIRHLLKVTVLLPATALGLHFINMNVSLYWLHTVP